MSVRVEDFEGLHVVSSIIALESLLAKRDDRGSNSYWLGHGGNKYPSLALLVKGSLASLHYFPKESHPGFIPVGNMAGLQSREMTIFFMDRGGEEVQIVNDAIVSFSTALEVAKEFFVSEALPTSIRWTEL